MDYLGALCNLSVGEIITIKIGAFEKTFICSSFVFEQKKEESLTVLVKKIFERNERLTKKQLTRSVGAKYKSDDLYGRKGAVDKLVEEGYLIRYKTRESAKAKKMTTNYKKSMF